MAHPKLWDVGRAIADSQGTQGLYDRLIEEARAEIKGKRDGVVHTLVSTAVPVRAATVALFSFHLMMASDNVPVVIRSAASDEGHRLQKEHSGASLFSELFTDEAMSWIPDGHFVSTFTTPARNAEEVVSDLTEVPEGGIYFLENEDGSAVCSVVRAGALRYYHIYPNDSGLLLVGPADLEAVCDSLVSVYPRTLSSFQRFVVQKNVLRLHMRAPD